MMDDVQDLNLNGTYTYADYLTWRFKERLELIKGKIFKMSPAPSTYHQRVVSNINGFFWEYLQEKEYQVFPAPFDVRLTFKNKKTDKEVNTVVQPDITVICDPNKLDRRGCLGAPDLVVEILSPSTADKDLHEKFDIYEQSGIKEYWIAHPEEQTLIVYTLDKKGKYVGSRLMSRRDKVKVGILDNFTIDLSEIFEERKDDF